MAGPIRHVILPWVQPDSPPNATATALVSKQELDASMRVSRSEKSAAMGKMTREQNPAPATPKPPADPWARLVQLPAPQIPEEDRELLHEESLVGAAILLDVFATFSPGVEEKSAILNDVAKLMVTTVLGVGGEISDFEILRDVLTEEHGRALEVLGATLQKGVWRAGVEPSPKGVSAALRAIEELAKIAIGEATLVLDGKPLLEIRQI